MMNIFAPLKPQIEIVGSRALFFLDSSLQPDLGFLRSSVDVELLPLADEIRHQERQREWILSRLLMQKLVGYLPVRGEHGELVWRSPHAGSLTHKKGHVALAIESFEEANADPGIDLEQVRDLHGELQLQIMTPKEQSIASNLGAGWSTAVFSAKESIFKCLFRSVGFRFYFEAVELIDAVIADDQGIMIFVSKINLGPRVPIGTLLRVDVKRVLLGAELYWITSARRGT